ncbi:MAG: DNA/RNA non-specific endonuclease [Candidatus Cloacimonetes bacterium]|nr:DNA/RNA non-specific endonuclease [Candidatus Cloacimonadota bacterium]
MPLFWLVLFLALGYYILHPGTTTEKLKESLAGKDKIKKVERVIKGVKAPEENQIEFSFLSIPSDSLYTYLLPSRDKNKQIVRHTAYTLEYDEQHEQADWVAYILDGSKLKGGEDRKDNFREDKAVKTGSATPADYRGSGYDRGHLAPAADMNWSKEAMSESFYMSNMSPQTKEFNRDIWRKLETQVRLWALQHNVLYVVTGPVFTGEETKKIGKNEVTVPEYYYKVILDYTEPELKTIGFILPNSKSTKELKEYAVTVNEVERKTGIDFFEKLPDDFENRLESIYEQDLWW